MRRRPVVDCRLEVTLPVYLVIHSTITDPEKMKAYREQARGTIPPEGVRLIAMDDALETLEGEAPASAPGDYRVRFEGAAKGLV